MNYCDKQDLVDRFDAKELIQITDVHHTGDIDDDKINRAITDASAKIDGIIGARYTLPLASVPDVLTVSACHITRYYLYDNRVPEAVENNFKAEIKFLEQVVMGKATLGIDEAAADNTGGKTQVAQGTSNIEWDTY